MIDETSKIDFKSAFCKVLRTNVITFDKDDIISTYIEKRGQIGILFKGKADLIRYDINGNKVILESFSDNDLFGEFFHLVNSNNELSVVAKETCEVLFFNHDILFNNYITKGSLYYEVINELMLRIADKMRNMNTKIEILSKRTIREKLISYFQSISNRKHSKTFYLDFSLSDLADYLCIDRSAMMREIKNLIDDGIIIKNKRKIKIIEH